MKILALDLGTVRTGVAVSDLTETMAFPLEVIVTKDSGVLIKRVLEIVNKFEVGVVVVSIPYNLNSSVGSRAEESLKLAERLKKKTEIKVVCWDERCSTKEAQTILNLAQTKSRKKKDKIDKVAATIILQSYLNYRKNKKDSRNEMQV